ncbi:hypothetical protein [Cyprinid herpesvirus 2]|nr:hypothetical protein [Cyprinid herpesvirus 2]
MVGHILNVLAHESVVHAQQRHGQRLCQKLLLDLHSLFDDTVDGLLRRFVEQVARVEQAGKISVETLVPADELVGKVQPGHGPLLLEPEDGRKRTAEKDALHSSKGYQPLAKRSALAVDPLHGPPRLPLDAGYVLDGTKQPISLGDVCNVRHQKLGIHLRVHIFDGHLETVETLGLHVLHFPGESLAQILVHYTIRGCKECQHVLEKMLLVFG